MIRGTKRPRAKAIEIIEPKAQKIDAKLNASIHNRFDIEVIDAKTGEIKQRAQAENVICNALWTRLLTPATYFNYIAYGTGSGTPSASDTTLFTYLGSQTPVVNDDIFNLNYSLHYTSYTRKIQLSETTAVGAILTEVGIIGSGTTICTHAMLKDMNGNQISIEKTNTDIINIYATIFVHWKSGDYDSGTIHIIPARCSLFIQWLSGVYITGTASFSAPEIVYSDAGVSTYTSRINSWTGGFIGASAISTNAANKTLTITATRLTVAQGNMNGIRKIHAGIGQASAITQRYCGGFVITPGAGGGVAPTNIISEAIGTGDGVTTEFKTLFPFVSTGGKIYIDGVEKTSGVSIDIDTPKTTIDFGKYLEPLYMENTIEYGGPASFRGVDGSSAANINTDEGASTIFYNPFYANGINSFTTRNCTVKVSDDLDTWTSVTSPLSGAYRYYKYLKVTATGGGAYITSVVPVTSFSNTNIHFDTPPAEGTAITADYTTKTIAKDANHVFDLTVTIQLGEYTE